MYHVCHMRLKQERVVHINEAQMAGIAMTGTVSRSGYDCKDLHGYGRAVKSL